MTEAWVQAIVAVSGLLGSALLTVRYFLKGKLLIDRERRIWIHQALKSFQETVNELRGISAEHRASLQGHERSIQELKELTLDLKGRMQKVLDHIPGMLEIMHKVHLHFEKVKARPSEVAQIGAESVLIRDKKPGSSQS